MPPKKNTRGVTSLPKRQLVRTRGSQAQSVSALLPKGNKRNKTTKTVSSPVVDVPDKEYQPPIDDLQNKEAPINAHINLNIDDDSPNIVGDDDIVDFQNLPSSSTNIEVMGNVNSFAVTTSTQGALTILGEEMSKNEFDNSLFLRWAQVKSIEHLELKKVTVSTVSQFY